MKIILTILMACLVLTTHAQVDFLKNTPFDEVLAKAQKENKIILLDAYTDWCGYCKKLDREVFAHKETGDWLNANFINYKINGEKGEGPSIAKKYFIKGFPTIVFLEPSGKVRHRVVGYKPRQTFVKEAQKALGMDPQKLKNYQEQYANGKRGASFLKEYIELLQLSNLPVDEPFNDLLQLNESDLINQGSAKLIYSLATKQNGQAISFIEKHRDALLPYLSVEQLDNLFAQNALIEVVKLGNKKNDEAFEEIIRKFDASANDNEIAKAKLSMMYYQNTAQWEKFTTSAGHFISKEKNVSSLDLNNAAWLVSQNTTDKAQLKKALSWCESSIAKESKHYNNDTKGWILYKMGKSKLALQAAEEAITIAKSEKKDYSNSLNLIKKINGLD